MLLGEALGEIDGEERSHDFYAGEWFILSDLYGHFQGAFGGCLLLAFLIPGGMVASTIFGWTKHPELTLLGSAIVFVACIAISLHSLAWFIWVKRRERLAFAAMMQKPSVA